MVYTLTLNPAIDYEIMLNSFVKGITNRSFSERYNIGGKGINVSYILSELGIESTALGFIAGFTGAEIEKRLREDNIKTDFIRLKCGMTRINIKLRDDSESEINCNGPDIDDNAVRDLMQKIEKICDGDTLVLAGSIPNSMSEDIYENIIRCGNNVRIIVDATKALLLNTLKYRPFLIKPNRQELCEIFGKNIESEDEIEKYARRLRKFGAQNVIISLGGDGALLIDEFDNKHRVRALKGEVIGTVGSGDSMVAGFIAGYESKRDYAYALRLGVACGTATAFSEGLAKKDKISEIFNRLYQS